MTIFHYSNQFGSSPLHSLRSDFGESNTDVSSWRPELSLIHSQASSLTNKRFLYDFPDGNDTGERIQTFIRGKGLDVTEIDRALDSVTQDIQSKAESDKKSKKDKLNSDKVKADTIKAIGDSVASAIASDSTPSASGNSAN